MILNTSHRINLPIPEELQKRCKSLALLDAILSPEWEYRYYSYNAYWDDQEEFFQMRDGEGDEMLILFKGSGAVINGFAHELYDFESQLPNKSTLTHQLPELYTGFIYGEPVASIGTTYCLWTNDQNNWQTGEIEYKEDGSDDQLYILDGNPQTYIQWAIDYYFDEEEEAMTLLMRETIEAIYQGVTLTKAMVLSLQSEFDDWQQLKEDLHDINYPHLL
ncbi:hypothetical protein HX004_12650 [Myroides sp. 1354]|uniref:hypothetical protein n=1 Tax=unclassified Myroides TaxID=2642485 RepID=UPI002575D2F4|nr:MULTISPECIES: hypothetical protein [unclassified Myroides]MDM1045619.1 hypothetical protein [Myroides sp. R163-1]MDM1056621.1 hypothetical protein [Myroides sp. 1354]MDM1069749.1 hypothetical protein [Myroides sp. 1372]